MDKVLCIIRCGWRTTLNVENEDTTVELRIIFKYMQVATWIHLNALKHEWANKSGSTNSGKFI